MYVVAAAYLLFADGGVPVAHLGLPQVKLRAIPELGLECLQTPPRNHVHTHMSHERLTLTFDRLRMKSLLKMGNELRLD